MMKEKEEEICKILENKDAKFNIENVKISDGKIVVDGSMTILKDKEQ